MLLYCKYRSVQPSAFAFICLFKSMREECCTNNIDVYHDITGNTQLLEVTGDLKRTFQYPSLVFPCCTKSELKCLKLSKKRDWRKRDIGMLKGKFHSNNKRHMQEVSFASFLPLIKSKGRIGERGNK